MSKKIMRFWVFAIPITAILLIIFLELYAKEIIKYFPACPYYTHLHIQCFGCGNTRSVMALLRGDIISSLKFNITPMLLGTLSFLLYLELITAAFGTHKKILPRKAAFWIILGAVLSAYFIIRNFV